MYFFPPVTEPPSLCLVTYDDVLEVETVAAILLFLWNGHVFYTSHRAEVFLLKML